MRRGHAYFLLVLLASCRADRITTEDPLGVTFEPHAWAGSSLQFVSSAFDSPDSVLIRLGSTTLPVQRLDSVTLVAHLPDTTGTFAVQWETAGRSHPIGSLTLHGGVVANRLAPTPDATAMAWPYGAGTFLAGVGGRLTQLDVFTGAQTAMFAESLYSKSCGWGAWPAGGGAVVLPGLVPGAAPGSYGRCRARMVLSTGAVTDSSPTEDRSWFPATMRLADGSWLLTGGNGPLTMYQRLQGGGYRLLVSYAVVAVWRLIASPDGRYAFAADGFSPAGALPILNGDLLDSPVVLPRVTASRAAAFSESGDTLAVQPRSSDTLFVVASRTGAILVAVPATTTYSDLAFDSGHPWLYAASADSGGRVITLTVYDLRTMRVATVLRARSLAAPLTVPAVYLSLDIWHRRLNLLLTSDNGSLTPGAGVSFGLLP